MKRKLFLLVLTIFIAISAAFAEQTYTLKTGVSLDRVPKGFYGTWRVSSRLVSASDEGMFQKNSVDLWNLCRVGNVITLDNPFSGAKASITIDEVNGGLIKFKKIGNYDGKKLTDVVELTLGKETFEGTNQLKMDTLSDVDGHVINSCSATYRLSGVKISGSSIKK